MKANIIGAVGSGKTSFLVIMSVLYNQANIPFYSNFHIKLDNFHFIDKVQRLFNLPEGIALFLDEGYTLLESRTSMRDINQYLSYLNFQSRKRVMDIYTTEQMISSIDKRYREQADYVVQCEKRINDTDDFYYTVIENDTGLEGSFIIPYEAMLTIFPLFDTKQIIEPYNQKHMEWNLVKNDADLIFEQTELIAPIIKKYIENKYTENDGKLFTKLKVKEALLKNKIEKGYSEFIWLYLNANQEV